MKKTFSIKTLGCKLNQYESIRLAERFAEDGWEIRPFGEPVDVVVVNTCTVTDRSDKKCRNYIRQGARFSRLGGTVVTGCLAQRDPEGLSGMPEVAAVFGNAGKNHLPGALHGLLSGVRAAKEGDSGLGAGGCGDIIPPPLPEIGEETPLAEYDMPTAIGRTRGFLKIQDGCDGECSYCIVPSVRGGPGSREFHAVIEEARRLVERGCPELVLTGITIGRYESGGKDLASLLEALSRLEGDFRLRVTSIEPNHLGERLVELLGGGRVCPHIHLPLQSGSDRILRLMRRPYTADEYMRIVDIIRKKDDKIAIGTDIIIGFPGEEEADFRESLAMVDRAGFSYVHQFSFSPRTGTPASSMPGACPAGEAVKRSARMRERSAAAGAAYRELFLGQVLPSVIERNRGRVGHAALSGNYIRMELPESPRNALMEGKTAGVRLVRTGRGGSFGELL